MPWGSGGDPYQPSDFGYDNWDKHLAPNFRAALQNIYGRGLDIGSEAPWQLVDTAFPRAGSAQLRQSHDQDLLDAARMFMAGQAPQKPEMVTPPPFWTDDASQSAGGIAGGSQTTGMSPAVGSVAGYSGPAMSLFGSVLGSPFSGAPALGIAALSALASGSVPGLNSGINATNSLLGTNISNIDFSNPVSRALESAFPLTQATGRQSDPLQNVVPVSPSFFNTAFTTPSNLQAAIVGAINQGNLTSDNALEAGVTPSQTQADAISSAIQALAQGLPTVSPGSGMNVGTSPGQASQHGNEAFSGQGLSPKGTTYGDTPSLRGDTGKLSESPAPPDQTFDFDPNTSAPPAAPTDGTGTGTGTGVGPGAGTGTGDSSTGGDPGGSTYKKGGIVRDTHKGFARKKGSHVVPIDAHEGEFVLNSNATKAARPALEALNALVPATPRNREDLAQIVERAAKYFDVA